MNRHNSSAATSSSPPSAGTVNWETVTELGDVVSGRIPGRSSDTQVSLFESQGLAIQDVATATKIYELATEQGLGQEIEIF